MNGKEVKLNTVQEAIDNKLAYVTEDRKGNGLILSKSIKINTSLANMKGVSNGKVIDADKEYAVAEEYRKKLKTKCPSVEQNVGNLSGGNQQKVLLAKWMFAEPDILILDEPTNGLDPIGIAEVRAFIRSLSEKEGKTILVSSHILSEISMLADDIGILDHGVLLEEETMEELKKKNQKYILLQVSDTAATARILEQQMALQVGEYSIQDTTSVKIFKTTIDREALVRELTLQGVGLSGLAEKDDTLEDYFKKITGGEGIA